MAADREQRAAESQRAVDEAREQTAWIERAAQDPEQQQEFIKQNNVIYGGLIAIGLVLVQPFLTVSGLDSSAKTCVIAFSVAIPLLAALLMVNHQETFRRQVTSSLVVKTTQVIAQLFAYIGVAAGFWHIMWPAGVAVMVSGFVAMLVHSAGFFRLEMAAKAAAAASGSAGSAAPQSPDSAGE